MDKHLFRFSNCTHTLLAIFVSLAHVASFPLHAETEQAPNQAVGGTRDVDSYQIAPRTAKEEEQILSQKAIQQAMGNCIKKYGERICGQAIGRVQLAKPQAETAPVRNESHAQNSPQREAEELEDAELFPESWPSPPATTSNDILLRRMQERGLLSH